MKGGWEFPRWFGGGTCGGELDDEADCLTWRGEESHKSPVASSECHTAPDLAETIFLCDVEFTIHDTRA